MKLIIEDDEGRRTIVPFLGEALNIGRADDNHVRLGEKNVSRKHGRILRKSGLFVVEDLSSFTGIRVNGEKVKGKRQIKEGDLIQISEFDLQLQAGPDDLRKDAPEAPAPPPTAALADEDEESTSVPSAAERRSEETAVIKIENLVPELKVLETVEVAEAERPRLVGANGALRGSEFSLARSPASIGRALENDVCLDHPQVSRSHCRLALVGGGWKVIDAESRHGVKVNGEPYAASPLHHGDVLEVGPVRLVFALPGKKVELPTEPAPGATAEAPAVEPASAIAPEREEPAAAAKGLSASKLALGAGAVLVAITAAMLLFGHQHSAQSETPDAADAALQRAGTSAAAHRYREAVRAARVAIEAGAPSEKMRALPSLEIEARAEEQYEQLVQAIARGDFDAARSLLDLLATVPTWFGGRALEHSQEVKSGYVKLHVERANAERGRDDAACLTEANLALSVNAQSESARALANECGASASASNGGQGRAARAMAKADAAEPAAKFSASAPGKAAPKAAPPAAAPAHGRAVAAAGDNSAALAVRDDEARRLLRQGNLEATSGDYNAAIADFERGIKQGPSPSVLGGLYRSLGATHSRAGNSDQGAHYYRLYLPYCDNPTEKAFLQKTLDQYDASRGRKP